MVTFRPKEKIREWASTGVIEINPKWRDWIAPIVCVHGDVHKFRLIFPPILTLATTKNVAANPAISSNSVKDCFGRP